MIPSARGADRAVARGTRVCVETGSKVEVPALATLTEGRSESHRAIVDEDRTSIGLEGTEAGQGPVRLPRPCRRYVGTVLEIDDTGLVVATKEHPEGIRIPELAVARLRVSRGRSRAKGALHGALEGATFLGVASGIVGLSLGAMSNLTDRDLVRTGAAYFGVGTMAGGVAGGLVGAAVGEDAWAGADVRRRGPSLTVAPYPGRGIVASVRF
jgi:hypothetical protein